MPPSLCTCVAAVSCVGGRALHLAARPLTPCAMYTAGLQLQHGTPTMTQSYHALQHGHHASCALCCGGGRRACYSRCVVAVCVAPLGVAMWLQRRIARNCAHNLTIRTQFTYSHHSVAAPFHARTKSGGLPPLVYVGAATYNTSGIPAAQLIPPNVGSQAGAVWSPTPTPIGGASFTFFYLLYDGEHGWLLLLCGTDEWHRHAGRWRQQLRLHVHHIPRRRGMCAHL